MKRILIQTTGILFLIAVSTPIVAQESNPNVRAASLAVSSELIAQENDDIRVLQQHIRINLQKVSVEKALIVIARKGDLKLMYNKKSIPEKKVTLKSTFLTIEDALWQVLKGTDLRFAVSQSKQLVLMKKEEKQQEVVMETVSGRVTDASTGESLPGVNVTVKNTTRGTSTDADGDFELTVESLQDMLEFSFIGYQTLEEPIDGRQEIAVAMQPQVISGDEVVVVGYGTQERSDLTGSVSSVSSERMGDQSVSNFEQALKGQSAGVQIFQNSGAPGSGTQVRIRGEGSITAGSQPLYVIDGQPITGGSGGTSNIPDGGANPLNNINPDHIESIDILKGASATAIYGSRGSNGVVLITTKTGIPGETTFNLNVSTGWQSPSKKLDRLNAEEFAELRIESRENGWIQSGGDPSVPNGERGRFNVAEVYYNPSEWEPTDWQDLVLRTGMVQDYNLSASGGSEDIRYLITGGYAEEQGVIIESSMERYDLRANINANITENLNVDLRFNPSYTNNDNVRSEGHFRNSTLGMALSAPPIIGPYESDGSYTNILALRGTERIGGFGAIDNPIANAKENQYELGRGRVLGNLSIEYQIFDNFNFETSMGIDGVFNRTHVFLSSQTGRTGQAPPNTPEGNATSSQKLNWSNENLLTYDDIFGEEHDLKVLLGTSLQKNDYRNIRVDGDDYLGDNVPYVKAAGTVESGTEIRNQWAMASVFSRINYGYDNRYLLTATIRRDGSSKFGAENKYGTFPSAALAWRVSEESFMEEIDLISNLKWRLSYGVSGNHDIPNYAHIAGVSNGGYIVGTDQGNVNATYQNSLGNPFLTWETSRSYNLGMDIGFFNDRLEFTADIYKEVTDGLILDVNIPAVSGFSNNVENVGEVENKGLEITVNSINSTGSLFWDTSFNISFNRNKVLALGGTEGDFLSTPITRTVVGKPMGLFYTRITDGIFNSQEEIDNHPPQDNNPVPGDRRFKDVNRDGMVNNEDRDFAGNPRPDFTLGFSSNLNYKGFEFRVLLNGSYGNKSFYNYALGANLNGNINQDGAIRDRWKSPEDPGDGKFPKAIFGLNTHAGGNSDWRVTDASYLRLTNATLAYNIPSTMANKIGLQNVRISLSGQNLYTLTNYPGYDPEIGTSGGNTMQFGEDRGIYPLARVIKTGINITF